MRVARPTHGNFWLAWPTCCRSRIAQAATSRTRRTLYSTQSETVRALQQKGRTAGIVTGMQGKRTFRVEIVGEASHAGTTPRRVRRDALTSALAVIAALQIAMWDEADTVR